MFSLIGCIGDNANKKTAKIRLLTSHLTINVQIDTTEYSCGDTLTFYCNHRTIYEGWRVSVMPRNDTSINMVTYKQGMIERFR